MPHEKLTSRSAAACNTLCLAEEVLWCATCAKNHHYLQCFPGNWPCLICFISTYQAKGHFSLKCSAELLLPAGFGSQNPHCGAEKRGGKCERHCRHRSCGCLWQKKKRRPWESVPQQRPSSGLLKGWPRAAFHAHITNQVCVKVTTFVLKCSQSNG